MVIDIPEAKGVEVPEPHNRVLKTLMSPELGNADEHTVLISIIKPGANTGVHEHDADEFMYVATGHGEAVTLENGEEKVEEVRPDSLIFAPEGEKHDVKNTGDESLKLFCVYHPALNPSGKFLESIEIQKKGE